MTNRQRILILCPHYRAQVTGSYECDETGAYRARPDGTFDLAKVKCGQRGGRCDQVFCVLHRLNRRGPGTWYPVDILAARNPPSTETSHNAAEHENLF